MGKADAHIKCTWPLMQHLLPLLGMQLAHSLMAEGFMFQGVYAAELFYSSAEIGREHCNDH